MMSRSDLQPPWSEVDFQPGDNTLFLGDAADLMLEVTDEEIAQVRKAFEACDPNGDDYIDRKGFHALLEKLDGDVTQEESLLDFKVADADGDGRIGFNEFTAWWTG
jgi:Ca2+-binding EF-hand superfamily protein